MQTERDVELQVMESVHRRNEQWAEQLNEMFTQKGVYVLNVMGAPGVGKTCSLIEIIRRLHVPCRVVEGDIESDLDARKLRALGIETVQINTGGACHLDSPHIARAIEGLALPRGMLFIENIGNLVCPAEFVIGEHAKLLLTAVTEGSDKPYKYPLAFEKADAILLGKRDLLPYVDFDEAQYTQGVRRLNAGAPIFNVSAKTGAGFDEVAEWIARQAQSVIHT